MSYCITDDDYTEVVCNKRMKLYKIIKDTCTMHILEHVGYKYFTGETLMQSNKLFNTRRKFGNVRIVDLN